MHYYNNILIREGVVEDERRRLKILQETEAGNERKTEEKKLL